LRFRHDGVTLLNPKLNDFTDRYAQ